MTVEQQVDALTASVEDLKGAVISKKATLDASVVDAQSATAQAQAAKANALSARDQAGAFKDAAYSAAQSAASAVAYQDLSAVALTKAVTAVDVFIYDTSKDSDGGAWRHRCAGTSWYREPLNTATRGARREFPAVAVIVAESNKVTIYDGDDPALPMWMVFQGDAANGNSMLAERSFGTYINALNGELVAGCPQYDAYRIRFVADEGLQYGNSASISGKYKGSISQRNDFLGFNTEIGAPTIASRVVNDVAMTVLPNAPIDIATGLPIPTIAVATSGGVSVIKDDGSVISSAETLEAGDVVFTPENELISGYYAAHLRIYGPVDQLSSPTFTQQGIVAGVAGGTINVPFYMSSFTDGRAFGGAGTRGGLTKLMLNSASIGSFCAAAISASYTTGWMPGAIRGAFLADTDDADLVGSGELVVNGTFVDGLKSWVDFSEGAGSISVADGRLSLVNGGSVNGDNEGIAYQIVPTVVGQRYQVAVDKVSGSSIVQIGYGAGVAQYFQSGNDSNDVAFSFVAATTTTFITIRVFSGNTTAIVEAVSMQLADADRSVNARGLLVNGTITRSPVATGADLVAYSGFNSANYLAQPYNPGLDFGTGDFCVMGWVELNSTGYGGIFHLSAEKTSTSNPGFCLYYFPTGVGFKVGAQTAQSTVRPSGNAHVCGVRSGTTLLLYLNGSLVGTYPNATNSATPSPGASLLVGGYYQTGVPIVASSNDKFALLRISATAPTADQIRRIYEDEKALFQENAACTLYGASDAVAALAHDPDTDLLHVGTSAGRSVFKGLRRVANTTTPVATAIAAAGDLVVEQ